MAKFLSKVSSTINTKHKKFLNLFLLGFAVILIAVGLFGLNDWRKVTTAPATLPTNETVASDTEEPTETKPSDIDNYNVPADQPRRIILSSISSEGIIQKVGLNDKNAISVPGNIHFAGWFVDSVKPGENGLSIIDGHVSGRYADGIFKNLGKLTPGDKFEVEYGDLTKKTFEVVQVKSLPESESAKFLLSKDQSIEKQLNLITCGGKFNNSTQTYDDRVIVVSKNLP